ncbi:hypothetical protein EDB84DRAFT_1161868 [Lactarius hengduanensis]|nr:hypothetical protein EDB84DRAFT_1161868 [Lactarius hengduanensis]
MFHFTRIPFRRSTCCVRSNNTLFATLFPRAIISPETRCGPAILRVIDISERTFGSVLIHACSKAGAIAEEVPIGLGTAGICRNDRTSYRRSPACNPPVRVGGREPYDNDISEGTGKIAPCTPRRIPKKKIFQNHGNNVESPAKLPAPLQYLHPQPDRDLLGCRSGLTRGKMVVMIYSQRCAPRRQSPEGSLDRGHHTYFPRARHNLVSGCPRRPCYTAGKERDQCCTCRQCFRRVSAEQAALTVTRGTQWATIMFQRIQKGAS